MADSLLELAVRPPQLLVQRLEDDRPGGDGGRHMPARAAPQVSHGQQRAGWSTPEFFARPAPAEGHHPARNPDFSASRSTSLTAALPPPGGLVSYLAGRRDPTGDQAAIGRVSRRWRSLRSRRSRPSHLADSTVPKGMPDNKVRMRRHRRRFLAGRRQDQCLDSARCIALHRQVQSALRLMIWLQRHDASARMALRPRQPMHAPRSPVAPGLAGSMPAAPTVQNLGEAT